MSETDKASLKGSEDGAPEGQQADKDALAASVFRCGARIIELEDSLAWLLASVEADPANERHPDDKQERLELACAAARATLTKFSTVAKERALSLIPSALEKG